MRDDRNRRRRLLGMAWLLPVLVTAAACGSDEATTSPAPAAAGNPFQARAPFNAADPALEEAASDAAAVGDTAASDVYERMDDVATGIWLTPEAWPTPDDVGRHVGEIVGQAEAADDVPVFVIYAIPDRDCSGGFSSGGLTQAAYLPWVDAVAAAAGGEHDSVVVLEPDALASSVGCDLVDARVALLRDAVTALDDAGVTTYVDGGHSDWVPAQEMAGLLERVGVSSVRGFATNVANYQPTQTEAAYAGKLSDLLDGTHYVIDTGRNGAGAGVVTDWCNPTAQALGRMPGYVDDGSPLDAYLWVKPPAESDGTCHGGPAAGTVWPQRALSLAIAAGW